MLRKIIPQAWKLHLKLTRRAWTDYKTGMSRKFAQASADQASVDHAFAHSISITQPILNATTEQSRVNKIHNVKLAARLVEAVEIKPNAVFSFWRSVGHPSKKNGHKKGINIINGNIVEDYGGGLCQLSSIIYHAALVAGLTVVERSNHSVDLYQHQERYTPLGSDSAVFFGYKDLRLRNDLQAPVRFRFEIFEKTMTCFITSPQPMIEHTIRFEIDQEDDMRVSVTTKHGEDVIAQSNYQKG